MYGLALKAKWGSNPLTMMLTDAADSFADGMLVDPDGVAAAWSSAGLQITREIQIRSTKTNKLRNAVVVRQ